MENSTYDLYTVPKDSDSQNPDGKLLIVIYYCSHCELFNLAYMSLNRYLIVACLF